jgi:hypothetical protein
MEFRSVFAPKVAISIKSKDLWISNENLSFFKTHKNLYTG